MSKTASSTYRIVVAGDSEVGKTTFIRAYMKEDFRSEYVPTKATHIYDYRLPKEFGQGKLLIADHGGESDTSSLQQAYMISQVAIICFAMDCPDSFANVRTKWVPEIREVNKKMPILLVATKGDLCRKAEEQSTINRNSEIINERSVEKLLADTHARSITYISAATDDSEVNRVFRKAIVICRHSRSRISLFKKGRASWSRKKNSLVSCIM